MSNPESGRSPTGRPRFPRGGYFFTPTQVNPIDTTQKEIDRSNAARGTLKDQRGVSTPVTILVAGGTLVGGGVTGFFIHDVFASDKPFEESIGSVPGGTSFSTDGSTPQLIKGSPPHLEQPKPANQVNPAEVSDNTNNKPQSVSKPETKRVKHEEVFDNEVTRGVITPAMKKIFSEKDLQNLDSFARLANQETRIVTARELIVEQIPLEKRSVYPQDALDVSFQVGKDKNTIEILPTFLDLSQTSNPDADLKYVKSFGAASIGGDVGEDLFKEKGYYDKLEFRMKNGSRIPKGTIGQMFLVNEDGGYLIGSTEQAGHKAGKTGLLIDIQAINGNIYRFLVMALKGEKIVSLEPLVPTPEFTPEFNTMPVGSYGQNIKGAQSFFRLSGDADSVAVVLLISNKGKIGERSRPGLSPFVVTNLEMFVPDGKVVASESSSNNTE